MAISLVLAVTVAPLAKAQVTEGAVDYMQQMATSTIKLKDETWQYLKAVTQGRGAGKVEKTRQMLLTELATAKAEVSRMSAFNGDDELRQATLEFLRLWQSVLKEDFDKIMDLEEVAEESYDFMEAYVLAKERANELLDAASDSLEEVQGAFAEEHGIELVEAEDKVSVRIKKTGEALRYYNQIYLIFFKCFKEEAYVLAALTVGDTGAIAMHARNLVSFASEGRGRVDTMSSFNGDVSLKSVMSRLLLFYIKEGEESFPEMASMYILKAELDKSAERLNATKERDRTQADIDAYNTLVDDYNKAIETFNREVELLNGLRKQRLQEYEDAVASFFDRHSG